MPSKKTTTEFIADARAVHGDQYDYDKVDYNNSNSKVIITCHKHGDFEQRAGNHLLGIGCHKCGLERSANSSRGTVAAFVADARAVHGDRYDYEKVDYNNARTKVIITCSEHGDFEQTPDKHINQRQGCPVCADASRAEAKRKPTEEFIAEARAVHGDRYGYHKVEYRNTNANVIIHCPVHGDFAQSPAAHLKKAGCPECAGNQQKTRAEFIGEARGVHGDRYEYDKVEYKQANARVIITCPEHGDFEQTPSSHLQGSGCLVCGGRKQKTTTEFVADARAVHGDRYGYNKVEYKNARSKVIITCPEHGDFEQTPDSHVSGQGCSACNLGWTLPNLRRFVKSLCNRNMIDFLSPAELFLLAQQNGLVGQAGHRAEFVKALTSGRLPRAELENFAAGEPDSSINSLFDDQTAESFFEGTQVDIGDLAADREAIDDGIASSEPRLPEVSAGAILDSVESELWTSVDEEAVEFLIASGVAKLWQLAYTPEHLAGLKADTEIPRANECSERIRKRFREQLEAAESLVIPSDYDFTIDGNLTTPNLMQRHVAAQVAAERRYGNWSGTGAGKTLSAVIASRVIESELTVILCPNSVIDHGWIDTIANAFPASRIAQKTLAPQWSGDDGPRYLVLNYETLQQPNSESELARFLKSNRVEMVVIDEIHYAKQRTQEASKRRRLTEALCAAAAESTPALAVLGMSATPVVNNLREGVSMVELVSGIKHHDLKTQATVNNCLKIHQRLVLLGTRWMPRYPEFGKENPRIDVTDSVDEIRELPKGTAGLLRLEQILVQEKLDCILENTADGTVIYTEYVEGIVNDLSTALTNAGWKVGKFTGQDKTGLKPFLKGELNVLIGSRSIGTGVNGLQHRADKLIIACAPWTAAAYEQLVGRLVRQGQERPVEVVFPITYASVVGEEWSWCKSRLNQIEYKKSIADAAVDGIVPTGHLRSPTDAFRDALGWLERLDSGHVTQIKREHIVVPLSEEPVEVKRRFRRYGDFSKINNRWNATSSTKLHERLKRDSEEWANYHTLYRKARSEWSVIPFHRIGEWITQLPQNRVVADFGCGEDLLGQELRQKGYQVYSFDHVAISDDVIVADVGQGVPLEDSEIDVAVFCLSLMGANSGDYLREAARVLVFDGRLVLCEPTSRLPDREMIQERMCSLGFHVTDITNEAQFTFIRAIRTDDDPQADVSLV